MKNIAIFASGSGTNAEKIMQHFEHNAEICVSLIVCNKPGAKVLERAAKYRVPTEVITRQSLYEEKSILKILNEYGIDFVVLAGFLWLVPPYLVKAYDRRMVNIHPALLPKYGGKGMYGMNVHRAVCEAKEPQSGITIHYVNEDYDEGDIVFQASCAIDENDTPDDIAEKVRQLEHRYFPGVVEQLVKQLPSTGGAP
ncbi:MAG: phosphoribosylglycinamide formyltransferase [Saprospiraceae bacterium]